MCVGIVKKIECIGERIEEKIEFKFEQLINEISKDKPRTIFGRKNNYEECAKLISDANKKLYLIEKTPVLIFGPRNCDYELKFFYAISNFVNRTVNEKQKEVVLLFSIQETRNEIKRIAKEKLKEFCCSGLIEELDNPYDNSTLNYHVYGLAVSEIFNKIKHYKKIENEAKGYFRIDSINNYTCSIVLADNEFAHLSKSPSSENAIGTYFKIDDKDISVLNFIKNICNSSKNYYEICKDLIPIDFYFPSFADYFLKNHIKWADK